MNRLLLIDGHNLHFQIFFGIRARLKKKPGKVSPFGVGFTGAMKRIIRFARPTHILVIFDGEHENPRRALLPTYKANRPDYSLLPDDENPYLQLPAVYKALDAMKIKYIETTEVEADDLIAICSERYRSQAEIVVCSHDKDFYQLLVGGKVRLMSYSGKHAEYYDEKNFREEFHITPRRFADYKALTGDKSDNIPGVRGVGNISATRMINQFGGVENIISRTAEIRQKKLRRCVIEGIDRMRLNYKLVKLGGDPSVPAPFALDALKWDDPNPRPVKPRRENREHPSEIAPEVEVATVTVVDPETVIPSETAVEASDNTKPKRKRRRGGRRHKKPSQANSVQSTVQSSRPETASPEPSAVTSAPADAPAKKKRRRRRRPKKKPAEATNE